MASSPLSNKKFKIAFIAIFFLLACFQYYTLLDLAVSPHVALKDSLASNILLGLFCWLIANNLSFYQPKENRFIYIIIWCMVLAGIFVAIIKFTFPAFDYSDLDYLALFLKSLTIRYLFGFLLIGCMASISILWYSHQEKEDLEQRRNEAEKLTKEAELTSLREKLQPHFLFNSLNSISALTLTKPQEARKMVHQLSDFLRGTLRKDDALSSLNSELEHLQLYLEIEKVRFGNRLNTEIISDEIALQKNIPPMLLQPLVENAIKFGLYDTLDIVTISIKAKFKTPYLEIEIINPFDASTAHPNKGTGFGMSSIQRRLNLLYNRSDLLTIKSTANQFITTIQIPQNHD